VPTLLQEGLWGFRCTWRATSGCQPRAGALECLHMRVWPPPPTRTCRDARSLQGNGTGGSSQLGPDVDGSQGTHSSSGSDSSRGGAGAAENGQASAPSLLMGPKQVRAA